MQQNAGDRLQSVPHPNNLNNLYDLNNLNNLYDLNNLNNLKGGQT